jgi:polar amino acid transport system ATP-binding protein
MTLEFRDVSKRFGEHRVFEHFSGTLTFEHVLALVGPSGGGKSTLLRIVAGLEIPDSGAISIDGVPIPRSETELRAYRRKIAVVFQAFNLFPHLSALENVVLPLREVHGMSAAAAAARAGEVLERFQLAAHAGKRPAALSGGQRQRVAIARAIATRPAFLLLDEPTSALDPEMTGEVLDLIAELRDEGRSLILVTHEMGFARQSADLVGFVSGGGVPEIAPPASFFGNPQGADTRRFLQRILRY